VQQPREQLKQNTYDYQEKFDKRVKERNFELEDLVLKWDARRVDKGKHGKFDNIWLGPFHIKEVQYDNTFILKEMREK